MHAYTHPRIYALAQTMSDKKIKAVLFDLGDTLLHFGKIDTIRLFAAGARSSYDYLKEQGQSVGSFTFYLWRNLIRLHLKDLFSRITGKDFDALALLQKIGTKKGVKLSSEQWQHVAWLWYEPLSRIAEVEPGTKNTLTELKNKGLKLGIVSNTFVNSSSLEKHLKQLSILDFFTVRIYSYEFDFRKPNLQIFRIAAERIGETLDKILFVGDRIDKDIQPAIKTGMHAVLKEAYTNTGKNIPKGIHKIKNLAELPSLIEKINAKKGIANSG
jgi:putative hydrolase of the HAD superfamily